MSLRGADMTTGQAERLTQFDYLLNAFELATQADHPSALSYGDKRRALFDYVRKAEAALDEVTTLRTEFEKAKVMMRDLAEIATERQLAGERLRARVQQLEQALRGVSECPRQETSKMTAHSIGRCLRCGHRLTLCGIPFTAEIQCDKCLSVNTYSESRQPVSARDPAEWSAGAPQIKRAAI
jgi:ribosomal protein L37AE/L43A